MILRWSLSVWKSHASRVSALTLLVALFGAATYAAQQSIYWKADVIRDDGGQIVAVATPQPDDTTAPTTPTSLGHSNLTATSVTLSWTGSTDSGGSGMGGYKIYRQTGSGVSLPVGTTTSTTFSDPTLKTGTSYSFRIVAFDLAQNASAPSSADSFTTP